MSKVQTNLRVIKASRKKPERGDVFAMQIPDGTYIFGRVIRANLAPPQAPMPEAYLIYVYQVQSETLVAPMEALGPDGLLLPPVFINQMPWVKGFFHTVTSPTVSPADLLDRHCFWDGLRDVHIDENQRVVTSPSSRLCGEWSLMSYRWLDDQISDALGIPRVPVD